MPISRRTFILSLVLGIISFALPAQAFAATSLTDDFNPYSDGLITSEYAYWNPNSTTAKRNANWEMTSGAVFSSTLNGAKVGYTGYPTYNTSIGSSPTTTSGNNSSIFRMTSKGSDFGNSEISFKLYNKQMISTSGTPAVAWDGVHIFLRYQSEESLYYASINRRDGSLAIKKKVPGGPSNGGTYYTLAGTSAGKHPIPYNSWQNIKATIKTNADKSVTIQLFRENSLVLSYTDNGSVGGAPILNPGKTGIRGDNDEFYFDDFVVNSLDAPVVTPTPLPDTTAPTVGIASPTSGAALSGVPTISANAADNKGVSKVDFYDGSSLIGSDTTAPYTLSWDTTKVSNGTHTLTTKAYDAAGNVASSAPVSVNINNQVAPSPYDTIAPKVTILSPAGGTIVSGTSVAIKATSSDNVKVAKIALYIDGILRTRITGSTLDTVQSLTKGSHTITIRAYDAAGNIGTSDVTITRL